MPEKKNFGQGGGSLLMLLGLGVFSLFNKAEQKYAEKKVEESHARFEVLQREMSKDFDRLDGYLFNQELEAEIRSNVMLRSRCEKIRPKVDELLNGIKFKGAQVDFDFFQKCMSGKSFNGAYRLQAGNLIVMLLESQEGFVQRSVAQFGYESEVWSMSYDPWWDLTHQIMKAVDASLQARGKEKMLFKPKDDLYRRNIIPIDQIAGQVSGTYFWHMGRMFI